MSVAPPDFAAVRTVVFDFDGVFTDNTVLVAQDGTEHVTCWRSDGLGLSKLRSLNVQLHVLSTERNPVVRVRCAKLGIEVVSGCDDKGAELVSLLSRLGADAATTCYVGNDINDAGCLAAVGLPVVVADAHPDVVPFAAYRTAAAGGRGAVREVCDLIAAAKGWVLAPVAGP